MTLKAACKRPSIGIKPLLKLKLSWYPTRIPKWIDRLFPSALFRINSRRKEIYLTFDDGPNETLTDFILTTLEKHQAKATFFCVGENLTRFPSLTQRIKTEGHVVANHSYHHLNGWNTAAKRYTEDIEKTNSILQATEIKPLFRPPYGKISLKQYQQLKSKYTIVFWSVLAGDFDPQLSDAQLLTRLQQYTAPGEIIVLHDNPKFDEMVRSVLPNYLQWASEQGYTFKSISC